MNPRKFFIGRTIVFVALLIILGGFFFVKQSYAPQVSNDDSPQYLQYTNPRYGVSFAYPVTYVIREIDVGGSDVQEHHTIILVRKEDFPLPVDGEGPPSITIDIYQNNPDNRTTEEWIRNTGESNFKLGEGMLTELTVDGLPALSYRWSGLYEGTTIALTQPNWVYAFTVTYPEMGAPIVQDFVAIRESILISE